MTDIINVVVVFNSSIGLFIFLFSNQLLLKIVTLSVIDLCILILDSVLGVNGDLNRATARNKLNKYTNTIRLPNCKFLKYISF